MAKIKEVSLRPYPGVIHYCPSHKQLMAEYKRLIKVEYPYEDDPEGGRYVQIDGPKGRVYLIWGGSQHAIAHEAAHICLLVFELIGSDPRECSGEPFCYLLSQILLEISPIKSPR